MGNWDQNSEVIAKGPSLIRDTLEQINEYSRSATVRH